MLIIAGRRDPLPTVEDAQQLHACLANGAIAELDASHLSNIEAPEAFTARLKTSSAPEGAAC